MTEETSELDNVGAEMDAANLYSEEVVTDRKVGVIRILTPIDANGQRDPSRAPIFTGETQIMTQMGPLPISFEIPAANVAEAVAGYSAAARARACARRSNASANSSARPRARSSRPACRASRLRRPPRRAAAS